MATAQQTAFPRTFTAGSAITQDRLVTLAADGKVDHATAGTVVPLGWAQEDAAAEDDKVLVHMLGPSVKAEASAAVTVGHRVLATTAGKVVAAVSVGNDNQMLAGLALEAASGDGHKIELMGLAHSVNSVTGTGLE